MQRDCGPIRVWRTRPMPMLERHGLTASLRSAEFLGWPPARTAVTDNPSPLPGACHRVENGATMAWRIRGTYFESCNCDAICPCRRIDGAPGGRSTHGVCLGVLSWLIEDGNADGTDLSGMPVALASRYSDDEPGSPWTWILYVDAQ